MDERFKKINRLLSEYSLGRFDNRLQLSSRLDEVDAFMAGINMLGEELKSITISRNYFTNIFNSVSDMVFILDGKGIIEHLNKSAAEQLEYSEEDLTGRPFNDLQIPGTRRLFTQVLQHLKTEKNVLSKESYFLCSSGKIIPVSITASYLLQEGQKKKGILLTAKDITLKLKTENLIIRAIIDTQENERQRLSKDLHDSLGQQLSAIKFYISATAGSVTNKQEKEILIKSNQALTEVIADMRNICFNLMPTTLEEFGLLQAVKELCNKSRHNKNLSFKVRHLNLFPKLPKDLEIDVYRVIQEFINNAMKHGEASKISIRFTYNRKLIKIILTENGKGFDNNKLLSKGMGLQNVQSRVKSHNGEIIISSEIGKGTKYIMSIPVN